jgi:hypothetical protein
MGRANNEYNKKAEEDFRQGVKRETKHRQKISMKKLCKETNIDYLGG